MRVLLIIFSFTAIITANSQNFTATYKVKAVKTYLDEKLVDKKKQDVLADINLIKTYCEYLSFKLIYNDENAIFTGYKSSFNDNSNTNIKMAKVLCRFNSEYYYQINKTIESANFLGKNLNLVLDKNNWIITEEKKVIGNYVCIKAILKESFVYKNKVRQSNIEAWFTKSIRHKLGPLGYRGLPGLILELKKNNLIYYLTNVNFNSKDKIKEISNYKYISQKELDTIINKHRSYRLKQ